MGRKLNERDGRDGWEEKGMEGKLKEIDGKGWDGMEIKGNRWEGMGWEGN